MVELQLRKMPVVLPHKLLPWMLENGIYPQEALESATVSSYWTHLSSCLPWACEHVRRKGPQFQPLWLWGDDAQYNIANDKLVTVAMGAVLDDRRCATATVWPLFCYRFDSWVKYFSDKMICSSKSYNLGWPDPI